MQLHLYEGKKELTHMAVEIDMTLGYFNLTR